MVIDIAYRYLDGMSLRKIASVYGMSHISIRDILKNELPTVDRYLYNEVMDMMDKKRPQTVEDEEVQKRILRAYQKLIEEDKTVDQIASEENVSFFTIYRDLTSRLPMMSFKIGKETLAKMNEMVLNTLKEHSARNLKNHNKH